MGNKVILKVENLKKHYPIIRGLNREVIGHIRAVDDVSFEIEKGQTLGLVGESGCGKSTTAKCIMRAMPSTDGKILIADQKSGTLVDITRLPEKELRPLRRNFQMVFQDPYRSINPRVLVRNVVAEPLIAFGYSKKEIDEIVPKLLEQAGLSPDMANRYPHAFSGGQRQRIAIARSLALNPQMIVLDESVSALDVSVQAQILNLLKDLQEELGLAYLFISHDLSVIRYMSDMIEVMYLGKILEYGTADAIFRKYAHPYTEMLLAALPDANPRSGWSVEKVAGEVDTMDAAGEIKGCIFAKRCAYAQPECHTETPEYRNIATTGEPEHYVACHHCLSGK